MLNTTTLNAREKRFLFENRCRHRHRYSEYRHLNCLLKEQPSHPVVCKIYEKVAIYDVECEDLKADYGVLFSWVIQDLDTGKLFSDIITLKDIKKYSTKDRNEQPREDTRIIKSFVDTAKGFNRLIGHYSSRFDLSFLRTRAVICNVEFPPYSSLCQADTWIILKNKFKLSRNSLENSHLKLFGFSRKDHLSLSIKHGCLRGEKWALDLTLKHNIKDVLDTRELWQKISPYAKLAKTSI